MRVKALEVPEVRVVVADPDDDGFMDDDEFDESDVRHWEEPGTKEWYDHSGDLEWGKPR